MIVCCRCVPLTHCVFSECRLVQFVVKHGLLSGMFSVRGHNALYRANHFSFAVNVLVLESQFSANVVNNLVCLRDDIFSLSTV